MKKNVFLTCAVFLVTLIIAGAAQADVVTPWATQLSVSSGNQAPFTFFGVEIDYDDGTAAGPLDLVGNSTIGYLGDTGGGNRLSAELTYVGGYVGTGVSVQNFTVSYLLNVYNPLDSYVGFLYGNVNVHFQAIYDADNKTFSIGIDPTQTQIALTLSAYQGYDYVASISVSEMLGMTSPYTIDLSNAVVGAQVGELHSLVTMRAYTERGGENPPVPTPEPATMVLFGAGLVGLAVVARKRKALKR